MVLLVVAVTAAFLVATGAPGTAGAGHAGASPRRLRSTARPLPTPPLTSALSLATGTWATLATGRLTQPVNRFWQALVLPTGSTLWALVTPPGVATNGGLVTTGSTSATTLVGFEPSQYLAFSPLASSSDAGRTWSQETLAQPLSAVPDSLALTGTGTGVALVGRSAQAVLESVGTNLSSWRQVTAARSVRRAPGARACGVGQLTAVAPDLSLPGQVLLGASCPHSDRVGILEGSGSRWALSGPLLPSTLDVSGTTVLRLTAATGVPEALVAADLGTSDAQILVHATRSAPGRPWTVSAPLHIGPRTRVVATAFGPGSSAAVVTHTGHITDVALAPARGGSVWRVVEAPQGAEVVALTPSATDAMVPSGSEVTVSTLDPATGTWVVAQRLHVPVQYGSSS